jgi:hypothetical protein
MEDKANVRNGFLAFMIAGMGANRTAPNAVFEEQIKNFKHIKAIDESDETLDCLLAIDKVEEEKEKLEIIKILIMKSLKLNTANELIDFIQKYTISTLEYLKEHEDERDPNAVDSAREAMDDMLGL